MKALGLAAAAQVVLPALLAAPLFLCRLGTPGLTDPDEGRNAEVAREMLVSGDVVTPTLNGARYLDKPPAFFWAIAASLRLFGIDGRGARLPSALCALAGVALTAWFADRRFGPRASFAAAAVLALCPLYIVFGRLVIFDMMLTLCMTASLVAAYEAMEGEASASGSMGCAAFAAAGIGTLTKGPVALILPILVASAWAILRGRPALLLRLRPGRGLAIYAAIVLPWLALASWRNPGYLRYALLGEAFERIASDRFETARPFYFYLKIALPGFFPWILYLGAAAARRLRGARRLGGAFRPGQGRPDRAADGDARRAERFAWTWLVVAAIFFSLVSSKRPAYILPLAVPLALLTGSLLARAMSGARPEVRPEAEEARRPDDGAAFEMARADLVSGSAVSGAACLLMAAALWLLGPGGRGRGLLKSAYEPLLARPLLWGMSAAGLALAGLALFGARRARSVGPALGAAVLPLVVLAPLALAIATQVGSARSARAMSRFLAERIRPGDDLICFEEYHPGLNFYLQVPVYFVGPTGRTFTSNYIKMHLDQFAEDPSFRKISRETMRDMLRRDGPRVFVVAPSRSYDDVRALAGEPLALLYEDPVGGVLLPASAADPAGRAGT